MHFLDNGGRNFWVEIDKIWSKKTPNCTMVDDCATVLVRHLLLRGLLKGTRICITVCLMIIVSCMTYPMKWKMVLTLIFFCTVIVLLVAVMFIMPYLSLLHIRMMANTNCHLIILYRLELICQFLFAAI